MFRRLRDGDGFILEVEFIGDAVEALDGIRNSLEGIMYHDHPAVCILRDLVDKLDQYEHGYDPWREDKHED